MRRTRFRRRFSSWRRKGRRFAIAGFWLAGFTKWLIASRSKHVPASVRRRTLERQGVAMSPPAIEPNNQDQTAAWNELRPVLHAEVERLPERYRIPVILSYLEGKTNEEVAALLRWPVGTVKGRLSRARDLLRSRLMRRGLTLSAAFLMTALSQGTVFAEVVPAELVKRTVRLGRQVRPSRFVARLDRPRTSTARSSPVLPCRSKVGDQDRACDALNSPAAALVCSAPGGPFFFDRDGDRCWRMLDRGRAQAAFSAFIPGRAWQTWRHGTKTCH